MLGIFCISILFVGWAFFTSLTAHLLSKMGNWLKCSCGYQTRSEQDFLIHLRSVDSKHWQLGTYVFHCETCGYGADYFEDAYSHVVRNPLHEMWNDGIKA
jgi:hypothetical protein